MEVVKLKLPNEWLAPKAEVGLSSKVKRRSPTEESQLKGNNILGFSTQ